MKTMPGIQIDCLRCDGHAKPIGIDSLRPRLSWILLSEERAQKQTACQVLVASAPVLLLKDNGDLWDSGKVESDEMQVVYDGIQLPSRAHCFWKVRVWDRNGQMSGWSEAASWEMGLLRPADWVGGWIGMNPSEGAAGYPWLRKTFTIDNFSDAVVYVTSLGYHELYINGEKVGDDVLSPAVTQFSSRAFYLTHNVTKHLRKGVNCIALWLGRGWYRAGKQGSPEIQGSGEPVACAQLEVRNGAGTDVVIVTDATWKACASPISEIEDFSLGWASFYDARLEQPGWNCAEFDAGRWANAQECAIDVNICAQISPRNKIGRIFPVLSIEPVGASVWLVDLGSNLAGWLKIGLPFLVAGQKILFDYYDRLLDEEGHASAPCGHDEYIASGRGGESFCNRFNYQGFRYVRITGLTSAPDKGDISAFLIHTDCEPSGSFSCSNIRLNAIHDMVFYTFRCLTLGGYMVDCPHYERLGYGGDGHASLEAALMMYDMELLYRSWLTAWRDCQEPDGDMPHVAPSRYAGGGPYWCAFIVAAPWFVYQQYGDSSILCENYPAMQRWLGYMEAHCGNSDLFETWPNTLRRNWFLGDWATPDGVDQNHAPSVKLIANCVRIYCYDIMAQIATALDRQSDSAQYRAKAESLRITVHEAFYDPVAKAYADGDQIDLAFPLLVGIVPEKYRKAVRKKLEQEILQTCKGHLGVGLVGVPVLVKTLMEMDRNDLIFSFTDQDTYPGWGYMLSHGATTTWEHWNGRRSHIHNCFNSIGAWFYQGLAGIRPDPAAPGFRRFVIQPVLVGGLTWMKAAYKSRFGLIVSEWKADSGRIEMTVTVPVGATAKIHIDAMDIGNVTESGKPLTDSVGVSHLCLEGRHVVCEAESGTYVFSWNIEELTKK